LAIARTSYPELSRESVTPRQLEASAQAPWTSTTVGRGPGDEAADEVVEEVADEVADAGGASEEPPAEQALTSRTTAAATHAAASRVVRSLTRPVSAEPPARASVR
jgi:hypothetical protein